jgi:2-C-methyl-D-erythritol 4-phosphate cytidylyltransferase/2-C-methyl-D-erythritol 2,4-cyclodiphosphate synthase
MSSKHRELELSLRVSLIIVAAGRGARMGGALPKQYLPCAGKPLICHTLEALAGAHDFVATTVVIHPDDRDLYDEAVARLSARTRARLTEPAHGGASRQASVRLGLEAQAGLTPDLALIHDGARPFASRALVERAIEAADRFGAAIPATSVTDSIKQIDAQGRIVAAPDRTVLRAAQTPQAFRFDLILDAHRRAARADLTDDAAVAAEAGHPVHVFEGEIDNMKVTTMRDLSEAEARLRAQASEVRVGQGFDVHAFAEGDGVWLCGLFIAHDKRLSGHSDADVALHALADAIYGALGDGDIGSHFPPSDLKWKGANSEIFLRHAVERVRSRGGYLAHLDVTLICEAPKIAPHREAMRMRIAEITAVSVGRCAVKATTSERLGFTGRQEGIAALALATVNLPPQPL